MKKQKMLISIFFAFVIFFSFPFFSFADMADETFTVRLNEKPFEITMLNEPYLTEYTPFIFTNYNDFSLVPDFLMKNFEYTEGSLYIRNNMTKESYLLLENVTDFGALNQQIYAIINKKQIGYVDLETSQYIELWNSKNADLHRILVSADHIYFADGDTIYRMLPSGDNVETIATFDGMQTYYPLSNYRISWVNAQGDCFVYHLDTGVQESYTVNDYTYLVLSSSIDELSQDINTAEINAAKLQNDISLPLSEYPVGSYFNRYKNQPCTCHDSSNCGYSGNCDCTPYFSSSQCMGFARYAADKYAHVSENGFNWRSPGDHSIKSTSVSQSAYTSDYNMQTYLSGTYMRVTATATNQAHSILVSANSGSSLTIYECNYSGPCKIGTRVLTFAQFRAKYTINDVVKHNFTGTPEYYNTNYHKVPCNISGCTQACLLQPHSGSACKCMRILINTPLTFN